MGTACADSVVREAAPTISRRKTAHFIRHFVEMCAPMCIGFALGDLIYFWAAEQQGYSEPFKQLPELSVLVALRPAAVLGEKHSRERTRERKPRDRLTRLYYRRLWATRSAAPRRSADAVLGRNLR